MKSRARDPRSSRRYGRQRNTAAGFAVDLCPRPSPGDRHSNSFTLRWVYKSDIFLFRTINDFGDNSDKQVPPRPSRCETITRGVRRQLTVFMATARKRTFAHGFSTVFCSSRAYTRLLQHDCYSSSPNPLRVCLYPLSLPVIIFTTIKLYGIRTARGERVKVEFRNEGCPGFFSLLFFFSLQLCSLTVPTSDINEYFRQ